MAISFRGKVAGEAGGTFCRRRSDAVNNDDDDDQDLDAEIEEDDDGMTIGHDTAKDISDQDDTPA